VARISIIVPCHNYGRFLPEALESLDAQTRPPDEIVIVDDGSTDDSLAVAQAYGRDRPDVVVLTRTPATGVVRAVADGVAASTGDLFAMLSADDRFSPTYLEAGERRLADPSIDFTWTATHQFGAFDRWRPAVDEVTERSIARRNRIHASGLMRRSLWDRLGGYSPVFESLGCEDWEYWVHALGTGSHGEPVHGCHLEWRRHRSGSRNSLDLLRVIRVQWALHQRHPDVVRRRDVVLGVLPNIAAFGGAWARTQLGTGLRPAGGGCRWRGREPRPPGCPG
jgi:glycosyltransferase involved in cell wall biosynthesis